MAEWLLAPSPLLVRVMDVVCKLEAVAAEEEVAAEFLPAAVDVEENERDGDMGTLSGTPP